MNDPAAMLRSAVADAGLAWRGAFHPAAEDSVPFIGGGPAATVVLLGFAGHTGWPAFACTPEANDGAPNPLDRWSRRIIDGLAQAVGAAALYPFGGPPWHPFQRWAMRAESVHPSPLGLLIHPVWGLWHSYRGALAFRAHIDFSGDEIGRASPCASCAAQPCLAACPVAAFKDGGFDAEACKGFVASSSGRDCRDNGCLARRACPVGPAHRTSSPQARFHMHHFLEG
jgi:hypothetical protein